VSRRAQTNGIQTVRFVIAVNPRLEDSDLPRDSITLQRETGAPEKCVFFRLKNLRHCCWSVMAS